MHLPPEFRLIPAAARSIFAALLLVLAAFAPAGLALAQSDDASAEDEFAYHEFAWAQCSMLLPPGGTYRTAEELGIADIDNPMFHALIWDSDGAAAYSRVMLGILTQQENFTQESFDALVATYREALLASYPLLIEDTHSAEFNGVTWKRFVAGNSETGLRSSVYSVFYGSQFYTLAFISPLDSDSTLERLAQEETLRNFGWLNYEDEGYFWFF